MPEAREDANQIIRTPRHRWRTPRRALPFAALVLAALTVAVPRLALGHQDPPGCSSTGLDFILEAFRADQVTPISLADTVSECETICVRAMIAKPDLVEVCAFQGGTVTITTPAGASIVADMNDIPCLGGTIAPCTPGVQVAFSDFACFAVTPGAIVGGQVSVTGDYAGAIGHTREGEQPDVVSASIGRPFTVAACPADTPCRDNFCNPALTSGGRTGLCTFTNLPSTTICRPSAGVCDPAELCTGTSPDCPADAKAPSTQVCRAANGVCDVLERCTGTTNDCPADGFLSAGTVCRASAGVCDVTEVCTGTGPNCPADGFASTAVVCRAPNGICDVAENCTGTGPACPADGFASTSVVCRPAAGPCDVPENCPGSAPACPPNGFQPNTTPCDLDNDICTIDRCDGLGTCVFVSDSNAPQCGFCGQFATGPCAITVAGNSTVFTTLQAAVDAAPDGPSPASPTVITVRGTCRGPTYLKERHNILVEGTAPLTCPPGPRDLVDTLMGDASVTPLKGSKGEVFKSFESSGIQIRYLNIVHGDDHDGVEFKASSSCIADCNCVALNDEGYNFDFPGSHQGLRSLVIRNMNGIRLRRGAINNLVTGNISTRNSENGIAAVEGAEQSTITDNLCSENGINGIQLNDAHQIQVTLNEVVNNIVAGIRVENGSTANLIDGNTITGNGDGLTNEISCVNGDLNTGSNVPLASPCR